MNRDTAEILFRAYRTGLLRREPEPVSHCWRPSFDRLLMHALPNCLLPSDRVVFRNVYRRSQQGLRAARQGEFQSAAEHFDAGTAILETRSAGRLCRALGKSFLEAAHAYLEYRLRRFDQARERVSVMLDLDLGLVLSGGFDFFEMHRLQAVDNLMRIDLREGLAREALSKGGAILAYVEGITESVPVHHGWRPDILRRIPVALRQGTLVQVAVEVALAFPKFPGVELWQAFSEPLELDRDVPATEPRVRQWLQIREACGGDDEDRFLALVIEFLPAGRAGVGPLWYATILDILQFCDEQRSPLGDFVRDKILRDAPRWPAFPAAFRPCIGLPVAVL